MAAQELLRMNGLALPAILTCETELSRQSIRNRLKMSQPNGYFFGTERHNFACDPFQTRASVHPGASPPAPLASDAPSCVAGSAAPAERPTRRGSEEAVKGFRIHWRRGLPVAHRCVSGSVSLQPTLAGHPAQWLTTPVARRRSLCSSGNRSSQGANVHGQIVSVKS